MAPDYRVGGNDPSCSTQSHTDTPPLLIPSSIVSTYRQCYWWPVGGARDVRPGDFMQRNGRARFRQRILHIKTLVGQKTGGTPSTKLKGHFQASHAGVDESCLPLDV